MIDPGSVDAAPVEWCRPDIQSNVRPFRGGFLIARAQRDLLRALPDGERTFGPWCERRAGSYSVHFDPMFPCHQTTIGDAGVLCLGYICDVVAPETPERTVECLAEAWSVSQDVLADWLEQCGGSFVLVAYRGDGVEVFLDATGSIGVCYAEAEGEVVAASHPNLLAELFQFRQSALAGFWLNHPAADRGGSYFPGVRTAFDEVRLLTPNTALSLPSGAVIRFYPRAELCERPLDEVVAAVVPMLHRQVAWIADRAALAVSLSGGLDTRVTLSAMRSVIPQCLCFTYSGGGNQVLTTDMEVATRLAKGFGLRHLPITIDSEPPPQWFLDVWQRTHGDSQRDTHLVYAYCSELCGRYIHVRSNVMEVARGFYTKNRVNRQPQFDAYKLSRLFRNATADEFTPYFQEFIDVTGFTPAALMGYHYTDLFYWEHRLGAWLSGLLRAARLDHFTFTLYNCRAVLETLIARPLDERIAADAMFALIREMWPELLTVPIFSGAKYLTIPPPRGSG
jgi:hypothetical protein